MAHDVVLIPGDGIGPEITQAMRRVVEATGVQINWNVQEAGAGVMDEFGTPLPQHVLDAVAETKVAIKGPITTPVGTGFRRALARSRSSRSSSSARARRPSLPIPPSRSSRSLSPRAAALWSTPLSTLAAAAAKR